jgi:peptidoglycan hydrolase-like protein with peptidoglycan-binding domain
MYLLSDKPAAIREVQRFLYVISDRLNNSIPRVAIDGIYGAKTASAVTKFQQIYGLKSDGAVDRKTFELLYEMYNSTVVEEEINDYVITEAGFPVVLGMQSDDVLLIHLLMRELEKTYKNIGTVEKSRYFSANSSNVTKELQNIFRMPETGSVDKIFYDRMMTELDSIRRNGVKNI